MRDVLVYFPEAVEPLWREAISAVSLGDGLLSFLSPHPAGRADADGGVRVGDELLLSWQGGQQRVRVELVRQSEGTQGWACFVVRKGALP